MGMVKDAFTGDIISDEEYARRLASRKYGISIGNGSVEYNPKPLAGEEDLPQFKGSLDNPYIMEPTKVAASRLPLADSLSGFGESRQKAIEESPPEAIEEKDSPRSLLSRMGGYAKDNPELMAQIAQLGGGLVANYAQGKAQEKADKKTGQRVARSNLISALSGGKIRPGVAEEVADSGGLLKTIGQVVQGGGKIAENEMGRRLAEETRLRGEKMEDEKFALKKREYEAERATEKQGTEAEQRLRLAKDRASGDPNMSEEEFYKRHPKSNADDFYSYRSFSEPRKVEINKASSDLTNTMSEALKDKEVLSQRGIATTAVKSMADALIETGLGRGEQGLLDIALIKALAKLQDPTSFVATDEFRVLSDSIPLWDWFTKLPKQFQDGSKLTPLGRKLIWTLAVRNYNGKVKSIDQEVTGVINSYQPYHIYGKENFTEEEAKNRLRHHLLPPIEETLDLGENELRLINKSIGANEEEITSEFLNLYGKSFNQSLGEKGDDDGKSDDSDGSGDDKPSEGDGFDSRLDELTGKG